MNTTIPATAPSRPRRTRRQSSVRCPGRTLARVAAAATLGAGLSLAAVAPAQAATSSTYQVISHPRPGCTYYHHLINGNWRGTAYKCDAGAAGDHAYQARVVCHDDIDNVDRTIGDPTPNHKPSLSLIDCPQRSGPVRGGYRDPA